MRELKFRASYGKKFNYFSLGETNRYPSNVMDFPVNQYTGLKDKNGTEIYEGDVLAKSPECQKIWIVYFCNLFQKFTAKQKVYDVIDIDSNGREICGWVDGIYTDHSISGLLTYDNFVISNIYQNPEYL